jgi:hypothetical protein
VYLAGIPVVDTDVLTLARLLYDAGFGDTAEALVVALEAEQAVVALSSFFRRHAAGDEAVPGNAATSRRLGSPA